MLLSNPDPVPDLTQLLRTALVTARKEFEVVHEAAMASLLADPSIATGTEAEVLASLKALSLDTWRDRREALPSRFAAARLEAAKLLEPKATHVKLPNGTL